MYPSASSSRRSRIWPSCFAAANCFASSLRRRAVDRGSTEVVNLAPIWRILYSAAQMTTTDTNSIRPLQRYRIEIDFATRFGGEAELLQQRINEFLESDAFVEGGALDEIKLHMSTLRALAPAGTPNADAQRIAQNILN